MSSPLPRTELVFELQVTCDPPTPIGRVGGEAMMIPITGGTVSGERVRGEVLAGGADWAVKRDDGALFIDAHYAFRTHDGVVVQVHNSGPNRIDPETNPTMTMVTSPVFKAPEGDYGWLNDATFVGTVTPDLEQGSGVHVRVYRVVL